MASEANVSERMVKKYIKELKALGLIRRNGTNRKGYWEIIKSSNDNQEIEESRC